MLPRKNSCSASRRPPRLIDHALVFRKESYLVGRFFSQSVLDGALEGIVASSGRFKTKCRLALKGERGDWSGG